MSRRVAHMTAVTPVLGSAILATLAVNQRRMFDAIVREDSVLEWGAVLAYGAAAVVSVRVAQHTRGLVGVAYGLFALAAIVAMGEFSEWPEFLFAAAVALTACGTLRLSAPKRHHATGSQLGSGGSVERTGEVRA